jgi:hypothetical protein
LFATASAEVNRPSRLPFEVVALSMQPMMMRR